MLSFLWGATAATSLVASMFFLRFWKDTRDRLFAVLSAAFCVFALNYVLLACFVPSNETRHLLYLVRLLAFALILAGIVDKNLRPRA
jgi:hypothetical protein